MPNKTVFRVAHVSGQDDNFKAVELNAHSPTTKGWQSNRFCLFPQDIVIQLDKRVRLRKLQILSHQYLIATKIEFYVGDVPEGTPVSLQNARYTRLGYVALSDNEKTGFKARELKSVHVDAVGLFVKFVIHKNHINKHNLYNQVGVVALNVISDELNPDMSAVIDADSRVAQDPTLAGLFNRVDVNGRPDYISPLDDLAFDMYQDPEVAQIIRKLETKKQEAVLQERYDFAKRLKGSIQELQKVGEKLGKFEVEKRQAVESEDYDKAKLKKIQSDEYRLMMYKQIELSELLELTGSRSYKQVDLEPTRQPTPPRLSELPVAGTPLPSARAPSPSKTPYDERPLPAIKKQPIEEPIEPPMPENPDDRPIKMKQPVPEEEPPLDDASGEPEAMSEEDQREASLLIEVFGLPLASKAWSKTWSFREDAILEVHRLMSDMPTSTPKEEARSNLRAAVLLVQKTLKDKVFAVFTASTNLLKLTLTEFASRHKISKADLATATEKTLPALLAKTGDTAPRMRDLAKAFIIEESKFAEVKPLHIVPTECVRPFKLTIAPRLALSRTEVVAMLYKEHRLTNSGLTVDNMMIFLSQGLQHTAGSVREQAEVLIIELYKDQGPSIKSYLPPDDQKTRKNVLYKQIFEAFDRIDGKPTKDDVKRKKAAEERAKQQEIAALQDQLQALRDMQAGKRPIDEDAIKDDTKPAKSEKKKKGAPKQKEPESESTPTAVDHMCIFCGEKNEAFTDQGLDVHYWRSCPMLKRCSYCKQVVEIASLTTHLLTECEQKDSFKKCEQCWEAVIDTDYEQHTTSKECPVTTEENQYCPLCHCEVPEGEDGWKKHLMGANGCKQNPRRGKQGKTTFKDKLLRNAMSTQKGGSSKEPPPRASKQGTSRSSKQGTPRSSKQGKRKSGIPRPQYNYIDGFVPLVETINRYPKDIPQGGSYHVPLVHSNMQAQVKSDRK